MRKETYCLAVALLLGVWGDPSLTAQGRYTISEKTLEMMVQYQPWLIQGQITSVEAKLMNGEVVTGLQGARSRQLPATEIILKVEKIIAGDYDGSEMRILLPEGEAEGAVFYPAGFAPMKIEVGDHAIVGIGPEMRGGYYILDRFERFFRIDGNHLIPYRSEFHVTTDNPLEIIARKAKEREMPELFKAADLVCLGTVTELINPGSASGKLIVSIDEVLKGAPQKFSVTVDVSDIYQVFRGQKPEYHVLLFLKEGESGYRLIAGINGYYIVEGDKLTRGRTVPLRMTLSQLKANVKSWKEGGQ